MHHEESNVEAEFDYIAIVHDVILTLHTYLAVSLSRLPTITMEVSKTERFIQD